MTFYAHSRPGRPDGEWELLEQHLSQVAALASESGESFGGGAYAKLAGLWHDLGKYSVEFQDYLRACSDVEATCEQLHGRVDHSTAGAQHAVRSLPSPANRLIAYCIAGHHAGLADWLSDSDGCLKVRLTKTIPEIEAAPHQLLEQPAPSLPQMNWADNVAERSFQAALFTRMVFSCLVDADFLATERFLDRERSSLRSPSSTVAHLDPAVQSYIAGVRRNSACTAVNHARDNVLNACLAAAAWPPGLFSLTVPTGGGKTLASVAFALRHATTYDLRRIIYAAPFTTIIEQNAQVYRDAAGKTNEAGILEHHSATDARAETLHARLAAENWDAPFVVTTNVQLLESLFASSPGRCRKLHRVARSIIILDEVQSLPVQVLEPSLRLLGELVRNYRCSVVLCSATQPAVQRRPGFEIGLEGVREIVSDVPALFAALRRTQIESIGSISDANLVEHLRQHEQILCIVNTKRHARKLFDLVGGDREPFHLSASMCPEHRSEVLSQVKARLARAEPCLLISTQVVETGVDIDFPVVYRAMTGVDSIAQAAGRCNREGRQSRGRVVIFEPEDPIPAGELRRAADTGRELIAEYDDVLSPAVVEKYFDLHYWKRRAEWDGYGVLPCFKPHGELDFRNAASRYRLISDEQRPVCIPWGPRGRNLCDRVIAGEPATRSLYRALQRFTVSVYPRTFDTLRRSGAVLDRDDGPTVLLQERLYDRSVGLRPADLDAAGWDPNELMV